MDIEVVPALAEGGERLLSRALARVGARLDVPTPAFSSAWRRAAAREAVNATPERYALSPRKTRGATRA